MTPSWSVPVTVTGTPTCFIASSWSSRPTSFLSPSTYRTSFAPFFAHFRAQALPSALAFFAPQFSSVIQPLQRALFSASPAYASAPATTRTTRATNDVYLFIDITSTRRIGTMNESHAHSITPSPEVAIAGPPVAAGHGSEGLRQSRPTAPPCYTSGPFLIRRSIG